MNANVKSCELQILKLGYNNLRPQHISYFAPALREERTLLFLDLSWNSLGGAIFD